MRLLDLFCCAGGAGVGYHRAGFEVVGVDIDPQPNYPFEFHQADALEYLEQHGQEFDAIHASPPCQTHSAMRHLSASHGSGYEDMLPQTREALIALGKPYVIENVPGAPMSDYITLCGSMFGLMAPDIDGAMLQLRRHRQFESNVWLTMPGGCNHRPGIRTASVVGYGGAFSIEWRDTPRESGGGKTYTPTVPVAKRLMGVNWEISKRELSESIPPAYTEFIGRQVIGHLELALVSASHSARPEGTSAP